VTVTPPYHRPALKHSFKNAVSLALKIGVSVLLLGFLIYRAAQDKNFASVVRGEKDVPWLTAAWLVCFASVTLTILRWKLLVQTLGMPFPLRDALRIGYVGYLCNLLPLGLVGGDAVKMVLLSHLHPTRKTDAVATVLVDRYLGLVALLFLAATATLLVDFDAIQMPPAAATGFLAACRTLQIAALAGGLGLALLFVPGFTTWSLWKRMEHVPLVGPFIHKLMGAMHVYRGRADVLLLSLVMSMGLHALYALMFYLVGGSLLDQMGQMTPRPDLAMHFAFVPIGMATGTLPIGAQEAALNVLYPYFLPPAEASIAANKGFLLTLVYRCFQVLIATLGLAFYAASRRELKHVTEEEEEIEKLEEGELIPPEDEDPQ
jgi:glycosyltransferase 2 family protein